MKKSHGIAATHFPSNGQPCCGVLVCNGGLFAQYHFNDKFTQSMATPRARANKAGGSSQTQSNTSANTHTHTQTHGHNTRRGCVNAEQKLQFAMLPHWYGGICCGAQNSDTRAHQPTWNRLTKQTTRLRLHVCLCRRNGPFRLGDRLTLSERVRAGHHQAALDWLDPDGVCVCSLLTQNYHTDTGARSLEWGSGRCCVRERNECLSSGANCSA